MTDAEINSDTAPTVFISYSWSTPDHQLWVLQFASALRRDGVDVRLDKWHLKEGQDALAFMESMVYCPDVKKVLLICDRKYVERANSREGGVGTEAQIISPLIYEDANQDKFAAVVMELDADGTPVLPIYMATRLYFDLSSEDAKLSNYEKILRWIYDKPFHPVPPLGKKPDFTEFTYKTGTALFQLNNIRRGDTLLSNNADAQSILDAIFEDSKNFVINLVDVDNPDVRVHEQIRSLFPVLENAYRAMRDLIRDSGTTHLDFFSQAFESLISRMEYSPMEGRYHRWDNDIYIYFAHDIFVSFIALCFSERNFSLAGAILSSVFYKPKYHGRTGEEADYTAFRVHIESLEQLNKHQDTRRISIHADLINEGHEHSIVSMTYFMEADIVLYIRSLLSSRQYWYPISVVYILRSDGSLPSFVRARSLAFYDRLKVVIFDMTPDRLRQAFAEIPSERRELRIGMWPINVPRLLAMDTLGTAA